MHMYAAFDMLLRLDRAEPRLQFFGNPFLKLGQRND